MKNNVSKKRNSSKKKKNKVTFKEYLRRKGRDIWYDREAIIFCVGVIAVFGFLYFMNHYNPNNDSEICTIESVEIIEHEDPYAISGVFETEECGTITMWHAPDGERIYPYLNSIEAVRNIGPISPSIPVTMKQASPPSALKKSKNNQLMSHK